MPEQTEQIAVFNAGSSSLKFSIYQGESVVCQGLVDRLESKGAGGSRATIRGAQGASLFDGPISAKDHEQALEWLFDWLAQPQHQVRPSAVGHRVVHGGDAFVAPIG